MARQNKDVFGFDELEKSFKRFEKNYPHRDKQSIERQNPLHR